MAKNWLAGALLGKEDAETLFPEKIKDPISGVPTIQIREKAAFSPKPYMKKQTPNYLTKKPIDELDEPKESVDSTFASGGKVTPYPGNASKHVTRRIISFLFVAAAIVGLFYFNRTIPGDLPKSITKSGVLSIATDHYVNNYDFRLAMTFVMIITLAITVNMLFNSRVIMEDTMYMLVIFIVGFMIIGTTVNNFVENADHDQREKALESWVQEETGLKVNLAHKNLSEDFFVTSDNKTVTVKNISKSSDSHTQKYSFKVTQ